VADNAEKVRKIGVFGGTFDPVHHGHLAAARGVLAGFRLDRLLFIPAAYPPHKRQPAASFSHRLAMLELALAGRSRMSISLLEAERQAPSYTVDTLHELRTRLGPQAFYLIIGADSFRELHLWYRYADLLRLADLVVVARPGVPAVDLDDAVNLLPGHFTFDERRQAWCRDDGSRIFYFADSHSGVSSSEIRKRLARGEPVETLLPPAVLHYIKLHGLYGVNASLTG